MSGAGEVEVRGAFVQDGGCPCRRDEADPAGDGLAWCDWALVCDCLAWFADRVRKVAVLRETMWRPFGFCLKAWNKFLRIVGLAGKSPLALVLAAWTLSRYV